MAMAETRHTELLGRRDRRRQELQQQRSLTLQAVEQLTSILVLPHPDRASPEVRRLRPNPVTEATAMRVVMEHEQALGRQVFDVSEKNLGYDITSVDLASGDLRLIEVKGSATPTAACCSPRMNGAWPRTVVTATGSTSSPTATRPRGCASQSRIRRVCSGSRSPRSRTTASTLRACADTLQWTGPLFPSRL